MLAIDHVRALLFGARGADDHVGRAGRDQIADLRPGQIFDEHRVGRLARRRRRWCVGGTLRGNCYRDGRAETNRCKQYALLHARQYPPSVRSGCSGRRAQTGTRTIVRRHAVPDGRAVAVRREYLTYVLWAITPEGRATNLGELQVNDNDGSSR